MITPRPNILSQMIDKFKIDKRTEKCKFPYYLSFGILTGEGGE